MSRENKNGTLILYVERGNEIIAEYSKNEIINKINSYFGYKLIDQIRLQTYNSKKKKEKKQNILSKSSKKFEEKINKIENKNGILILYVERGDEIVAEYSKKEIINKINAYFGYKLIDQIRLQTYNSKKKSGRKLNILNKSVEKFKKKINEVKNKDIRNSLSQLLNVAKND
jgi:hypothetical protein